MRRRKWSKKIFQARRVNFSIKGGIFYEHSFSISLSGLHGPNLHGLGLTFAASKSNVNVFRHKKL